MFEHRWIGPKGGPQEKETFSTLHSRRVCIATSGPRNPLLPAFVIDKLYIGMRDDGMRDDNETRKAPERDGSHGSPYRVQVRSDVGEEERTMAIDENGQRPASDGAPLGKQRLSGNWRITEYRVRPEPGAQSFEQVFRFDKEAKPSL